MKLQNAIVTGAHRGPGRAVQVPADDIGRQFKRRLATPTPANAG